MYAILKRLLKDEDGQGITEYALILGLVVFGIWVLIASTDIGASIRTLFANVKSQVDKCSKGGQGCGGGS